MSTKANPNPSARPGVRAPVIAMAAVVLVAFLSFLAYQAFTPKVYAPPAPLARPDASKDAFNTWAKQRYRETGGDWSKLLKEDQQRFMDASRGKGRSLFESFKP